ncbi:MAG: RDD family protein [Deltaproteobacteria bacterium]|nr:RDD family protein [Deltaproteobacteria bacterium]
MADNICPYCGFPNEAGVKVCKKCRKPYSIADFSHVVTEDISFSGEKETLVEKTEIDFSEEEDSQKDKKADIHFDSEEEIEKPTQPIESQQILSRQFYAATFLQRLASLITDSLLVFICTMIIWFAGVSFSVNPNMLFSRSGSSLTADIVLSFFLLYILFGFFYSMLFHHLSSRTIGKMLMGLYLVEKNSYRVSFYRLFARNILFALNVLTLFIGFIWIIADERGQALHDKLSGTFVVSEEIK